MSGVAARRFVVLALFTFWSLIGVAFCALSAAAPGVRAGTLATLSHPAAMRVICARVMDLYEGPDGREWASVIDRDDERRVMRAPVADMVTGCAGR